MKISFNTFVNQTLSVLTVCMILPLAAQADQVVVADANGNQLIYSYDGADGPAKLMPRKKTKQVILS